MLEGVILVLRENKSSFAKDRIANFHEWLPLINYFVRIKCSLS